MIITEVIINYLLTNFVNFLFFYYRGRFLCDMRWCQTHCNAAILLLTFFNHVNPHNEKTSFSVLLSVFQMVVYHLMCVTWFKAVFVTSICFSVLVKCGQTSHDSFFLLFFLLPLWCSLQIHGMLHLPRSTFFKFDSSFFIVKIRTCSKTLLSDSEVWHCKQC